MPEALWVQTAQCGSILLRSKTFELAFVEQQRHNGNPSLLLTAAQAATALGLYLPVPKEQRQEIAKVATALGLHLPANEPDARVPLALVLLARAPEAQASRAVDPKLIKATPTLPPSLLDLAQPLSVRHLRLL